MFKHVDSDSGGELLLVFDKDASRKVDGDVLSRVDFRQAEHRREPVSAAVVLRNATKRAGGEQARVDRELGFSVALGDLDRGGVEPGLLDDPAVLVSRKAGHSGVPHAFQHSAEVSVERFFVHEVRETERGDGETGDEPTATVFFLTDEGEGTVDDGVTPLGIGVRAGKDAFGPSAVTRSQKIAGVGVGTVFGGDVLHAVTVEEALVANVSAVGDDTVHALGALSLHWHVLVHGFGHGWVLERLDPGEDLFGQGDLQRAKGIALVSEEVVGGAVMLALDGNASRADVDGRHMGMLVGVTLVIHLTRFPCPGNSLSTGISITPARTGLRGKPDTTLSHRTVKKI